MEYGFDRLVHDKETTGPYGDNGAWDWGPGIDTIFWLYQNGPVNSTWKFSYEDHVKPIIEAHPTWYQDGTTPYAMNAMAFPGTCRLRRESSTGKPASSGKFIFSAWVQMGEGSSESATYTLFEARTAAGARRFAIERAPGFTNGAIKIFAADAAGNTLINDVTFGGDLTASTGWVCLMISGDRSLNRLMVYANDTELPLSSGSWASTAADIDFNGCTRWAVGGDWDGTTQLHGGLGQVYLDVTRGVDLSQQKLRRAMYSEVGKPISPGSDGHRYVVADTMNQPAIYMGNPDDAADWDAGGALNRGSYDPSGAWSKAGTGSITAGTPP